MNDLRSETYTIGSNALINTPNVVRWALHRPQLNKKGREEAAKLYMLAAVLGQLPAAVLMDAVTGQRDITYHDDKGEVSIGPWRPTPS
jgi:hypothetical protein